MRNRTDDFVEEATWHFRLASIGPIITDVNYSDMSITPETLIPSPTIIRLFNRSGTFVRRAHYGIWNVTRVRCRNENRDGAPIQRLKIIDRAFPLYAHYRYVELAYYLTAIYNMPSRNEQVSSISRYPGKKYNSRYYFDKYDIPIIDRRLNGFSDNRAKFDPRCIVRTCARETRYTPDN